MQLQCRAQAGFPLLGRIGRGRPSRPGRAADDRRYNLYCRADILPPSLPIRDSRKIIGDPKFVRPGGFEPADYVPVSKALVQNKGIVIERLPGDAIGLKIGLAVATDFLGKPIADLPDLGAIEVP